MLSGLFLVVAGCSPPTPAPAPDMVLSSVRVVDIERGELSGIVDVSIRDGLIQSIDETGEGPRPDSLTRMVDASGTFGIPGLHDMHSHLWSRTTLGDTYLDDETRAQIKALLAPL
jgi:predicted amidohydrolase